MVRHDTGPPWPSKLPDGAENGPLVSQTFPPGREQR
jgi:hypothetical protein